MNPSPPWSVGFVGHLVYASVATFILSCTPLFAESNERPNLIFILADDLGYGDLGCYGQEAFQTPRIDRMAREGLRFTQHYAGSTVCAPSRACLLTGQHTGHVHQRANGKIAFRQDPQDRCLASILQEAGYATAMIGKSGLACRSDDRTLPNAKGFDHFFGYLDHASAHRYYPRKLIRNGHRIDFAGNHGKQGDTYSGDLFLDESLDWMERNQSRQFFLHIALQQPHLDLNAPAEWRDRYLGKYVEDAPFPSGHYRAEDHPKATFAAMIGYLDHSVGRVIDRLKQLGIAENTLVLFSSDNGPVNEGGWSYQHFQSSGPLRGCKRDLYEGGVRVPLIAWWPGRIEAGRETDHVSAFWDFASTACDLAGCKTPDSTDGLSYLPTVLGRGDQPKHAHLYWEFYERGGKQAVRYGDWKGVRVGVFKDHEAPIQLYNLAVDLAEEHDVSADHPDVVARLAEIMRDSHTPTDRFSMPMPPLQEATSGQAL